MKNMISPLDANIYIAAFHPAEYKFHKYSTYTREITNPNACIVAMSEGYAVGVYNGEQFTLHPGEIMYIPSFCHYVIEFFGEPNITYRTVHFNLRRASCFDSHLSYKLQKVTVADPEGYIRKLWGILDTALDGRYMSAIGEFLPLFEEIKDNLEYNVKSTAELVVEPAVEHIDRCYAEKITDDFLAKLCHLSVSRFHVLFKEAKRMTPMQYKNGVSLHHATEMLRSEKSLSIEEIAERCGFASPSFFRRLFLRNVKMTPREFRRRSEAWML